MLVLAGCGGTQQPTRAPTPDIDATVAARIREERAAEVTVEPKAQAIAKAMVEATATPVASPASIVQVPTVPAITTQTPIRCRLRIAS